MCTANYLNNVTSSKAIWISTTTGKSQEINIEHSHPDRFIVLFERDEQDKPRRLNIKDDDVIEYDNVKYRILAHIDDEYSCTLTVERIEMISQPTPSIVVNNNGSNVFNVSGSENKINANQGNNSANTINQTLPNSFWEEVWEWFKNCPLFNLFKKK
ncbi:MAG: hypothetical protein IJS40_00550 [Synergistaceae bacterium]|nr:hypothetical protein [Synergistaceae bacterium]